MTEAQKEPRIVYKVLSTYVMVVAKQGIALFDWAAYVFPVPGQSHDNEWYLWRNKGSKLRRDVAELMFPDFARKYQWRP